VADYGHLAGHRFPGGTYTLPPWLCWLWADVAKLEPSFEVAHPALAYQVAMQGSGVSIQDIFDLMDATADSGVVFGEYQVDYHGVFRPGVAYDCNAEVIDVERKSGRRAGVFDKFSFKVEIRDAEARELVAVCTNSWIFPRADGG
jgi:acyl dehydratase